MAEILKGAPVAAAITENVAAGVQSLKEKGINTTLEVIRVGEDPSDLAYERGLLKRMEKCGIEVTLKVFPQDVPGEELEKEIERVNSSGDIHGCLMFRPLKDKALEEKLCGLLDPAKDVDSMTKASLSSVFTGSKEGFPPCTAQAVTEILDHYGIEVSGKNAVVVGRSLVIGKPVAMMLLAKNATVTICHTKTKDLKETVKKADIVIAAAGKAEMLSGGCFSEGQTVIDVGINMTDAGLVGDVCFDDAEKVVSAITPVPGGVGSVTTAVLAKHVYEAAATALEGK